MTPQALVAPRGKQSASRASKVRSGCVGLTAAPSLIILGVAFALDEYEAAFSQFLGDAIHSLAAARDPMLREMGWEVSPGTTASVIQDQDGQDVDLAQDPIPAEVVVRRAPIRKAELVELWLLMEDMATQLSEGMAKGVFATLDRVTSATGNVVDAGGEMTFETFLKMLDKIEWSLTDDDELSMPTLVVDPETAKKLPALTASQNTQLEELQARKLDELLSRRRRRRLS